MSVVLRVFYDLICKMRGNYFVTIYENWTDLGDMKNEDPDAALYAETQDGLRSRGTGSCFEAVWDEIASYN